MRASTSLILSVLLLSASAAAQPAQDPDAQPSGELVLTGGELQPGERYQVAPRRVEEGPTIDGNLDEEVWLLAAMIDEFTQQEPSEGDPATERTVVRLLYDARALYIGVEAHDSEPDGVIATEMRRDSAAPAR